MKYIACQFIEAQKASNKTLVKTSFFGSAFSTTTIDFFQKMSSVLLKDMSVLLITHLLSVRLVLKVGVLLVVLTCPPVKLNSLFEKTRPI